MATLIDKRKIDVVRTFLVFLSLVGDCEKTAVACDLDPATVRALADSEGWAEKVKRISLVSRNSGNDGGEWERIQNRVISFVQASRMRSVLDRCIVAMHAKEDEEMLDALATTDKNGDKRYSARFLADMAAALEKTHQLCYLALQDTAGERKATAPDSASDAAGLHSQLIAALNGVGKSLKPSDELVKDIARTLDIEATLVPTEQPCDPAGSVPIERKCLPAPAADGERENHA